MRIGITIGLRHPAETLWNNGIKQNALFLAMALGHCPNVHSVVLVNTTPVPVTDALPWDLARWPTTDWHGAKDGVDVMIELGGQLDSAQTDHLKRRGARLVSYCCASEYVSAMESILFGRALWGSGLFINQRYDDIWMVPQVAHGSRAYFEVLRRHSAQTVPFVWSPVLLDQRTGALPNGGCYAPHGGPRRLTVMEPNIDINKFCLYPVLIAEIAYRQRPADVDILQVTNAQRIARESMEFITLMNQLDIVREHKAVFLGRHETPAFLAGNTDIVISHQGDLPLNYFHLEVCWQGYALVHNAALCSDLGYPYAGNDVDEGARQVIAAMDRHDAAVQAFREGQRTTIGRHLPDAPALVRHYAGLLDRLVEQPVR